MHNVQYGGVREVGSWDMQIGRLKRTFSVLTSADLNFQERNKEDMVKSLALKLSISSKEIVEVMEKRRKM